MGWAARTGEGKHTTRHRAPLLDLPGCVCVVSGDRATHPQFAQNLTTIATTRGSRLLWYTAGGGEVARARNTLVRDALEGGARWVAFLDDDHIFEQDLLGRLLRHDVDIVVPTVMTRKPPHRWVAWEPFEIPPTATDAELVRLFLEISPFPPQLTPAESGLIELGIAGTGAMLVRAEVFETLPEPWFRFGGLGPDLPGEDTLFCLQARRAGFRIWCDVDVSIGHLTTVAVWPLRDDDGEIVERFDFSFGAKTHVGAV